MAKYFVKTIRCDPACAIPGDGNDGLDPLGLELAGATYNDVVQTITCVNGFLNYTHVAGDQIYITAGTGAVVGLYTIFQKIDDDHISLTESAGVTDVTGDWETSDGPWLTVGGVVEVTSPGDIVVFCDDGDHVLDVIVRFNEANSGAAGAGNRLLWTGGTARGVIDGTHARIDGDDEALGFYDDGDTNSISYTTFQCLDFWGGAASAGTADGFRMLTTQIDVRFFDCKFYAWGRDGIRLGSYLSKLSLTRCEFYDNDGSGIKADGNGEGALIIDHCSFHDNGQYGVEAGFIDIYNSLIYDNISTGVRQWATNGNLWFRVIGCTIQGNGGDGIYPTVTTGTDMCYIANNIISENGGYGINLSADVALAPFVICGNNVFDNNTAGATSIDGIVDLGATGLDTNPYEIPSQELDPNFLNIADGFENLIPQQNAIFTAGAGGVWQDSEGNDIGGIAYDAERQPHVGAIPSGPATGGGGFIIGG